MTNEYMDELMDELKTTSIHMAWKWLAQRDERWCYIPKFGVSIFTGLSSTRERVNPWTTVEFFHHLSYFWVVCQVNNMFEKLLIKSCFILIFRAIKNLNFTFFFFIETVKILVKY